MRAGRLQEFDRDHFAAELAQQKLFSVYLPDDQLGGRAGHLGGEKRRNTQTQAQCEGIKTTGQPAVPP
jgi:hypothetical protein